MFSQTERERQREIWNGIFNQFRDVSNTITRTLLWFVNGILYSFQYDYCSRFILLTQFIIWYMDITYSVNFICILRSFFMYTTYINMTYKDIFVLHEMCFQTQISFYVTYILHEFICIQMYLFLLTSTLINSKIPILLIDNLTKASVIHFFM